MAAPDLTHYKDREQAYVKHCLIKGYLPKWAYKVGSQWDSLVYVDGFAGPWETKDPHFADSSFGIAHACLISAIEGMREKTRRAIRAKCIFVEKTPKAFAELERFTQEANKKSPDVSAHALCGDVNEHAEEILRLSNSAGRDPFRFVFLDPKGWNLNIPNLLPLIKARSCEVLVTLMTKDLNRFMEVRPQSVQNFLGSPDAVTRILGVQKGPERTDAIVDEFCRTLREQAEYEFASTAVIFAPNRKEIQYYMVYGTNSDVGVEVFKKAELEASRAQDQIRREDEINKDGGQENLLDKLFTDGTPLDSFALQQWRRYCKMGKSQVGKRLLAIGSGECKFGDLYCEAMKFPMVRPTDLHAWLNKWCDEGLLECRFRDNRARRTVLKREDVVRLKDSRALKEQIEAGK